MIKFKVHLIDLNKINIMKSISVSASSPLLLGSGSDTCLGPSVQTPLGNSVESPRRSFLHRHPEAASAEKETVSHAGLFL